jgi:predicted acylesterase/phospholipase RssA
VTPSLRAVLLLVTALVALGCAHYPVNAKLDRYQPAAGYRLPAYPPDDPADQLFICLSFSGGGTRAAALAYGVMAELKRTEITWNGAKIKLLDEVDCISSVSGGSFTSAYYGLFGERLFQDFYDRFLIRDIQGDLIARAALSLPQLASPYWSRIDVAAQLYDQTVFEEKTYAALVAGRRRPFVILNATDMVTGEHFEFTQSQFDFLGSDLTPYPLARAVAASSAFPFLLAPLTLVNHSPLRDFGPSLEYVNALRDFDANPRRWLWAEHQRTYLDGTRPYVHLMDGGLSDNIGLRSIERAYRASDGFIAQRINGGATRRLVVIAVNARTEGQDTLSARGTAPGLIAMASATATVAMGNYSFATVEFMRSQLDERLQAARDIASCQKALDTSCPAAPPLPTFPVALRTCMIEVAFEALVDPERRNYFLHLGTNFHLPKKDVDALIGVGGELLRQSTGFKRLLDSLAREAQGLPLDPPANCN